MLALLPIFLLIFSALTVFIVQRLRSGFGIPWLASLITAIIVWVVLLLLGLRLPVGLILPQWLVIGETAEVPAFQLDEISWPYAFSLAGLLLGMILTASARLIHGAHPRAWVGALLITAVGLLAVIAANPLTLILAWTAIDLVELVLLILTASDGRQRGRVVVAFAARVAGSLALLWAILQARAAGVTLNFSQIPPQSSVALLVSAGLRLGVLPLHLPYVTELPLRRGFGTMLRLISPAASLILLARIPAGAITGQWATAILIFSSLAALFGALLWVFATDEMQGRPFWLVALAGLAVASVVRGLPQASVAWGCALLLSGGLIFFYSVRERGVYFLPVLGLIGLTGLPFTPAAVGWSGVWTWPFSAINLVFLIAHITLLVGYLRLAFKPGDVFAQMDTWVRGVYTTGLIILVITHWVMTFFSLPASFGLINPLPSIIATLMALGLVALQARAPGIGESVEQSWAGALWQRVWGWLSGFFRLEWLYSIGELFYTAGRGLVRVLTNILEGDAGVLWAMVLLFLLISLIRAGGGQ